MCNQTMPLQHSATVGLSKCGAQWAVHGREPGEEAVPLRLGTLPLWVGTGAI